MKIDKIFNYSFNRTPLKVHAKHLMKYIIYILLSLFICLIFRNYKKGFILFLILTPIINNPALYFVNVEYLPLITMWRIIYISIILKYLSIYYFNKNQYRINGKNPFVKNFILIAIALFTSFIMNEFIGINKLFSIIIEEFLLFIIVWDSIEKSEEIISVFKGLVLVFFICTLYGVYCRIINSNPFHTEILSVISGGYRDITFGECTTSIRAGLNQRVASLFYNPISYGGYLGMILPFLLFILKYSKNTQKVFCLLTLLLIIINVFFTNSRSAIVISISAIVFYYNFQNINIKLRFLLISLNILVLILFFPEILGPYVVNVKSIIYSSKMYDEVGGSTLHGRMLTLNALFDFIEKKPLLGYGMNGLNSITATKDIYSSYHLRNHYHFLAIMFDYGLFGFFAYLLYYKKIFSIYNTYRKNAKSSSQKLVAISGLAMLLSWMIFVNITGNMNVNLFFTILISLSIKFCSLEENKYNNLILTKCKRSTNPILQSRMDHDILS